MDDAALAKFRYDYCAETGEFLWRNPPPKAPKSKACAGAPAGSIDRRDGNRQLSLDGKIYPAARIAWLIVKNEWPRAQVCYEDPGLPIPARDAFGNLRLAGESQELTQERLRRLFDYDADEGILTWLVSRKGVRIGSVAGGMRKTNDGNAYWYVRIDGIDYAAQRLVWLWVKGEWPSTRLSFKNGRPADIWWDNLAEGQFAHGSRQDEPLTEDERRTRQAETYRKNDLQRRFGLTRAGYRALLAQQEDCCAICGQPETETRHGKVKELAVDHDHATGAVRGLLCKGCNTGIGLMLDDPAILRKAAAYLEAHAEKAMAA